MKYQIKKTGEKFEDTNPTVVISKPSIATITDKAVNQNGYCFSNHELKAQHRWISNQTEAIGRRISKVCFT